MLKSAFEEFGDVKSVRIIKDRLTGESRGFAFVEMPDSEEAQAAISNMNDKKLEGKQLRVNEAREKEERTRPSRPSSRSNGRFGGYSANNNGQKRNRY